MLSFRRTNRTHRRKGRHGKGTHRRRIQGGGNRDGEDTPSPLEYLTGQAQELLSTVTGNETVDIPADGLVNSEDDMTMGDEEEGGEGEVEEDEGEEGGDDEEGDEGDEGEDETDEGGEEDGDEEEGIEGGEEDGDEEEGIEGDEGEDEGGDEEMTAEGEEGEVEEEDEGVAGEDETTLMGTLTKTLLGTPSEETETVSVDPKQDTIANLMREYHFKEMNICLTKDLPSKMATDDVVYTRGIEGGKYTKDFGENEPVLVVLYIFPNPLVTGMVIADDSSQLPEDATVPAGHNARVQTRKLWVPFPGVPGVHIRIHCGVVETMMPVNAGEKVTLNTPVGLAVYSGKLGNLDKYYSVEELQSEEKTVVDVGADMTVE